MSSARFKRPLLYSLIASVCFGALLGIVLVMRNQWGWFETRIMLTAVVVAGASVCGLACDLSRLPQGFNLLPNLGLASTLLSAAMLLFHVWMTGSAFLGLLTMCVNIFAVGTVHVCLLSIARLTGRMRWVFFITSQLIYGLVTLLILMLILGLHDAMLWRFVAVLSITIAALTLVIPILYRFGRSESNRAETMMPNDQRSLAAIDAEIASLRKRIETLQSLRTQVTGIE